MTGYEPSARARLNKSRKRNRRGTRSPVVGYDPCRENRWRGHYHGLIRLRPGSRRNMNPGRIDKSVDKGG